MRSRELDEFVGTLPPEIQELVYGKRNKGTLRVLAEYGIEVPQRVLDACASGGVANMSHDELMDCMRPFEGLPVDHSKAAPDMSSNRAGTWD